MYILPEIQIHLTEVYVLSEITLVRRIECTQSFPAVFVM